MKIVVRILVVVAVVAVVLVGGHFALTAADGLPGPVGSAASATCGLCHEG